MLKKSVTYDTFDGKQATDTLYFNLTKAELLEWEMSSNESLVDYFSRIAQSNDRPQLMKAFKDFLMMTVGQKSEDGKHFRKSEEIRNDFVNSAAYDAFFWEFFQSETAAVDFIKAVLPKDLVKEEDIVAIMKTPDQRLAAVAQSLTPPPPPSSAPNDAGM